MVINFTEQINVSVQVGDLAWYFPVSPTVGVPGNQYNSASSTNALLIGVITAVGQYSITVDVVINPPSLNMFIMFSKDDRINRSNVLGYYARVKMTNHSKEKIELFAVGSEISMSSK
tara:strand:+ start:596 stop:946 length:351 start_codon:yes stop_codon:yes gene_type:complete